MPDSVGGQRITLRREPNLQAKLRAFAYQQQVVESVRELESCAIFLEQGLGKSKVAADLILHWLDRRVVDTVLYVTKKSLIVNVLREFEAHTYLRPMILSQDAHKNYYVFNSGSRLMLTHYEVLTSEHERLNLLARSRSLACILDESAKIKNPESSVTRAAFELTPLLARRVIMTGTPIPNRPYDLWAQIWFLDQGASLGQDFAGFKRQYDLPNSLAGDSDAQMHLEQALNDVYRRIASFCVRMTKGEGTISLPRKEFQTHYCDWERRQFELYEAIRKDERAIVVRDGVPSEDKSEEVLKRLLRLVQVASNPILVDQSYSARPGKYEALESILYEVMAASEKCIVWTSFIDSVAWLRRELAPFGARAVHGRMSMEEREQALKSFKEDDSTRVLVATPGAAKEGLTLTVANHVVFWDRSFSLDDYLQAQDRIHRISQTRTCYIHNLVMSESVDEWVDALLKAKRLAAQLAQRDIGLESYRAQMDYNFGEMIRDILGISA